MRKEFSYVYSSELDVPLRIRVVSLFECAPNAKTYFSNPSGCMLIRLMVFCNGRYVGRDVQTSFRGASQASACTHTPSSANRELQKWNEWLTLPIRYAELSRDAILHVSLWDITDSITPMFIAQCSKSLFSKRGIYRSGQLDLRMKRIVYASVMLNGTTTAMCHHQHGGKSLLLNNTETALRNRDHFFFHPQFVLERKVFCASKDSNSEKSATGAGAEKSRATANLKTLHKKVKLYTQHLIDRVNWLDKITFSRIEEIKQEAKMEDRYLYLIVEMSSVYHAEDVIPYMVIFYAEDDDFFVSNFSAFQSRSINTTVSTTSLDPTICGDSIGSGDVSLFTPSYYADPELGMDNLCELKHHMLTRNARANNVDRRLQPNPSTRDAIEQIINAPSSQEMSMEEQDVIWKFRFWLKSNPRALVKFIRSVNWEEGTEVKHAIQVILEWEPIDACDALELLTPSFTHPFVRRYAVSRLHHTTYANILLFLPQLVQALRYETKINANDMLFVTTGDVSATATSNTSLTSSDSLSMQSTIQGAINLSSRSNADNSSSNNLTASMAEYFGPEADLASFLIREACHNSTIANFLYWYLKVEIEANTEIDESVAQMFSAMMERLKTALGGGNFNARQTLATLNQQKKFVDTLVEMAKFVAEVSGSRSKKLELLKKKLAENPELLDLKGLSLPLDPTIHVKNILADATILFSSNMMPMRLTFSTVRGSVAPYECGEAYTTIFKRGDDLRQDQLVIQMIRLMDSLLKAEKLDLCLTPYAVLATSVSEGFVQFVKATPIADLKSIQDTLRMFRPSSVGPYGVEAGVLNNYVRSCAGYSVICYILGIGDRHLHNLLLCENGRMFHVDFGFILGRDPKPMPPPMKLTSEMVNAMGGPNSEHFKNFVDYITEAFCILRRNANLIINLFSLMLDAGIPDIAIEKEKAVQRVLERFHLQMSDECACQLMNRLVETSMSAKMPILVDFVHDVKQFISN